MDGITTTPFIPDNSTSYIPKSNSTPSFPSCPTTPTLISSSTSCLYTPSLPSSISPSISSTLSTSSLDSLRVSNLTPIPYSDFLHSGKADEIITAEDSPMNGNFKRLELKENGQEDEKIVYARNLKEQLIQTGKILAKFKDIFPDKKNAEEAKQLWIKDLIIQGNEFFEQFQLLAAAIECKTERKKHWGVSTKPPKAPPELQELKKPC